jgi:hypothetical protein
MEGDEFTKNGSAQEGAKLTWEYQILQGGVPTVVCNGLAPQGGSEGACSQWGAPPLTVGQLLTGAPGRLLEAVSQSCSLRQSTARAAPHAARCQDETLQMLVAQPRSCREDGSGWSDGNNEGRQCGRWWFGLG